MKLRLFLLVTTVGVALSVSPPLSSIPKSLWKDQKELFDRPNHYAFNIGLEGAVTQEDWDRATLVDVEPPVIVHPNLNGNPDPVTVTGKYMQTIKNRTICAFQGIRFAEPPLAEKRFKKPEPAQPYFPDNTLMANHLGEKCPQGSMFGPVGSGSEDCLNLNVYTPYFPDQLPGGEKLPVMMWIHGGGFVGGDSSLYLPTKLLDHDVILVVMHYRLGSLGFFSLLFDEAPGNAGLWDQIEALKWINKYIEGFGGDKNKVTIFGESAGSTSVNWLLLLPEAKGLFHGVIGESGSALEHWSIDPEPLVSGYLVSGINGCPNATNTTVEEIFNCMIDVPADDLALNLNRFLGEDRARGEMGFRGAAPVMDGSSINVTLPLITKSPEQYFIDGNSSDVPLIIGTNKQEGSFVLAIMYLAYLQPHGYLNDTEYLQNQMMIDLLNCFGVTDQTNGIGESLVDAYVGGQIIDFDSASPGLVDLAGVLFLKAGGWNTAKMKGKYMQTPAFFYSFDFLSDDTMFRWLFMGVEGLPFQPGVTHADELMYLFSFPAVMEGPQIPVMDRMTTMWTNFARYGDPTPDSIDNWKDLGIPKWERVTVEKHPYMLVQRECHLMEEFPDRWHITWEETINPPNTEIPPTGGTQGPSQADFDQIEQERQAFMISMSIFIVSTVLLGLGCAILFFKKR